VRLIVNEKVILGDISKLDTACSQPIYPAKLEIVPSEDILNQEWKMSTVIPGFFIRKGRVAEQELFV